MENYKEYVYLAKIAEQAERYDEMADFMNKVVNSGEELTIEERNLLSVAYKNRIGARRASWRIIGALEGKAEATLNKEIHKQYKEKIEDELNGICKEIIDLLDNSLLANKTEKPVGEAEAESKVFFLKMKGDYCRYKAEIAGEESKSNVCQEAEEAYKEADKLATEALKHTNPIRLGLYLNYSVFYYELCEDHTKACKLAKRAFDQAIAELDSLNEDKYKDSTLIMQLLRDNLTLWTSDAPEDADDGDDAN